MDKTVKSLIAFAVIGFVLLIGSCSLWEVNNNGFYKVRQAVTGEVSVINETGIFWQGGGTIYEYTNTNTLEFDVRDIRFNDGSVAERITGTVQIKMPVAVEEQLKLHKDYRGYDNVMNGLVKKLIYSSMKESATLMKAEQFYSSRREEFRSLTENQARYGIYEKIIEGSTDDNKDEVKVRVKYKDGKPVISAMSLIERYGIEINQLLIDEVKFDLVTEELIAKRKEAEKAKQERLTEEEKGKAKVAKAEAEKLVEKIQATTDAQKEFEVAQYNRQKEEENAKALLATGKAQAEADRLKVQAGLSPKEKAEIEANARVQIAEHMSKLKFPEVLVVGGGQNGKQVDPFDAMGLHSLKKLVNNE
jgi:regulator of protease activity HflC (stomatin/prohibitin superfamily)